MERLSRRNFLAFDFGQRRVGGDHWIRVHRVAMACRFEAVFSAEDAAYVAHARAALDEADRIESILTVFRPSSTIVDINRRAAREAVRIDPELFTLLERCHDLHAATLGAFDLTTTSLSRCWGFLMRKGRLPSEKEIKEAREVVGMNLVDLDRRTLSIRFARQGVELNFGAIGKGYALDRMAVLLRTRGARRTLLSAGRSSVLAQGGRGRGWRIDIRPRLPARPVARLWIRNGAVGTSGAGEQFFEADGKRYGHVIDPRTGHAAGSVCAATVITRDAASADALSTAFLIGGCDLARRYCATHANTLAVLVLDETAQRIELFGHYNDAILELIP